MSSSRQTERAAVGFGGGCHWCTEAVFQALRGVEAVEQGWIRSEAPNESESEAVLVHFRPEAIALDVLIEIHLRTHASTSDHSFRDVYRSAIYTFGPEQAAAAERALDALADGFDAPLVTQVLPFAGFRLNDESLLDYYRTRPDAPFCQRYIDPKLRLLRERFGTHLDAASEATEAASCTDPRA